MPNANIIPHLYLDTNVILDAIHNRWPASVQLMKRIKSELWECSTSRFTVLEMLDIEQEQIYIENLLVEGHLLSRVRDFLGIRRQQKWGLKIRELHDIYQNLYDQLSQEYSFIKFEHPIDENIWDKADDFCASTNIGATDAIHLASAITMRCNLLITRDKDFRNIADDYILTILPEDIDKALTKLKYK